MNDAVIFEDFVTDAGLKTRRDLDLVFDHFMVWLLRVELRPCNQIVCEKVAQLYERRAFGQLPPHAEWWTAACQAAMPAWQAGDEDKAGNAAATAARFAAFAPTPVAGNMLLFRTNAVREAARASYVKAITDNSKGSWFWDMRKKSDALSAAAIEATPAFYRRVTDKLMQLSKACSEGSL